MSWEQGEFQSCKRGRKRYLYDRSVASMSLRTPFGGNQSSGHILRISGAQIFGFNPLRGLASTGIPETDTKGPPCTAS